MAKFKVGDRIDVYERSDLNKEILCHGVIERGPYIIDDVIHYDVIWEYDTLSGGNQICELRHTTLEFEKSIFKFLK